MAIRCGAWATIICSANWRRETWSRFAKAGVKKMVSICPHCVRTIGVDWKEHGGNVADRAPHRVAGPLTATSCRSAATSRRAWCFTTPAIWADIAACMTNRAR